LIEIGFPDCTTIAASVTETVTLQAADELNEINNKTKQFMAGGKKGPGVVDN